MTTYTVNLHGPTCYIEIDRFDPDPDDPDGGDTTAGLAHATARRLSESRPEAIEVWREVSYGPAHVATYVRGERTE